MFDLDQVARYVSTGIGKNPAATWNTFSHARSLADPADTFVTINNDTVYSMAQLDMSVGPILLTVPDTAGLVPSEWTGDAPAGAFRPIMRMYEPSKAILDQSYTVPAIRRVGSAPASV